MLLARTAAEALIWLDLRDLAPVGQTAQSLNGGTALTFRCIRATGDPVEEHEFVLPSSPAPERTGLIGGPEPSSILSTDDLVRYGSRLAASVPCSPMGFVREAARDASNDLLIAASCLEDASRARGGAPELETQAAGLRDRILAWRRWLSAAQPNRDPAAYLEGPEHCRLDPLARRSVEGAAPLPVAAIARGDLGPWGFVGMAAPREGRTGPRGLFRHPGGAMLWVRMDGSTAVSLELVQGADAVATAIAHAFVLQPAQRLRLRMLLREGQGTDDALAPLGQGEAALSPLFDYKDGGQRIRFLRLDLAMGHRTAVLATISDDSDRLLGHRVIEGHTALEQLHFVADVARFVGPSGDAEGKARLWVRAISGAVRPLLLDLAGPKADVASLRPSAEDCAHVFRGPLVAQIFERYEALWNTDPPSVEALPDQADVLISVCTGGGFQAGLDLAKGFHRGWRKIADILEPGRTWVAWTYARHGEPGGRKYDGLVWVDDHWVWFPRPYLVFRNRL